MGLSDHIVEVRDGKLMKDGLDLVPEVLSLPPSRKYPGWGWSRVC